MTQTSLFVSVFSLVVGIAGLTTIYSSDFGSLYLGLSAVVGILMILYLFGTGDRPLARKLFFIQAQILVFLLLPIIGNIIFMGKLFSSPVELVEIGWRMLFVYILLRVYSSKRPAFLFFSMLLVSFFIAACWSIYKNLSNDVSLHLWNHPPVYLGILIVVFLKYRFLFTFLVLMMLLIALDVFQSRTAALGCMVGLIAANVGLLGRTWVMTASLLIAYSLTALFGFFEYQIGLRGLSAGRGEIWGFWLDAQINKFPSFFFGLGDTQSSLIRSLANSYDGNVMSSEIMTTFHSSWVNIFVTRGVLGLLFFSIIVFQLLGFYGKNNPRSPGIRYIFYFSLITLTFNSSVSVPGPSLLSVIFLSSLILIALPFERTALMSGVRQ